MQLAEIWRFPVKSMAGERLASAELRRDGIEGDRLVQAWDERDRIVTARTRPGLLGLRAVFGDDGQPRIDGLPWTDPEVARRVEQAAGRGVRLRRFEQEGRFDVLPLLVVTDGSLAAFGRDSRRLRPNLVIAGVAGLAERDWEGRAIRVGGAVVGLADLRGRCVMTTFDPDTQKQDIGVLRDIASRFDGRLGLNALVLEPARIAEGDPVELLGRWNAGA
jgi:MOSC domain-containing protein